MAEVAVPQIPSEPTKEETTELSEDSVAIKAEDAIKHPLNNRWCLWYFVNDKNIKWEDSQVKVAAFNTVEDFWALFNHVESASRLKTGCDYSLFKEGVKPMWEDPINYNGGRWSIQLTKQQRQTDLDRLFMELIMMMIGENEEECVNNEITGAVVNVRPRGDRIALWTASANNQDVAVKVGRCMKDALSIPANVTIEFNKHSDTSSKRSSTVVRALYSV